MIQKVGIGMKRDGNIVQNYVYILQIFLSHARKKGYLPGKKNFYLFAAGSKAKDRENLKVFCSGWFCSREAM